MGSTNDVNKHGCPGEMGIVSPGRPMPAYGIASNAGGDAAEAMKKLKQLKQHYDPANIFHNNCMNISLEW